jgi:hypothetical protein
MNLTITYTWDFPALEYYPTANGLNQVVHTVHWRLNGTDGNHTTSVYGAQSLSTSELDPTKFIAYANLTPNTVQEWVISAMGASMLSNYEDSISRQLDALINPPNVTAPPPWFYKSMNLSNTVVSNTVVSNTVTSNTGINTSNTNASNTASYTSNTNTANT